uniref:Uncharacterized protein n=1 Tax=Glossina palpalis gambiensis TaxID=67801 RepID=A0A1B0B3D1_9MUSC
MSHIYNQSNHTYVFALPFYFSLWNNSFTAIIPDKPLCTVVHSSLVLIFSPLPFRSTIRCSNLRTLAYCTAIALNLNLEENQELIIKTLKDQNVKCVMVASSYL